MSVSSQEFISRVLYFPENIFACPACYLLIYVIYWTRFDRQRTKVKLFCINPSNKKVSMSSSVNGNISLNSSFSDHLLATSNAPTLPVVHYDLFSVQCRC